MWLLHRPDPTFFPGRAATIYYRPKKADQKGASRDVNVGTLGILHPTVLENFDIGYPCSALELELELFKKEVVSVWEDEA